MRNIRYIAGLSLALCLASSCSKDKIRGTIPMTLTLGFEDSEETVTKTYLNNGKIEWGSKSRYVYVFDSEGAKNTFSRPDGDSSKAEATTSFTGSITEGSSINYVIFTGKTPEKDNTSIDTDGCIIGAVLADQKLSNAKSFAQKTNISIMKPGDTFLKNVYGYIKMTLPAGTLGFSKIYSVSVSADEDVKGSLKIDYSGTDPVATIAADGSKSLTIRGRYKNGYAAGDIYLEMVPGTYHNLKFTITPFEANGGEGIGTGEIGSTTTNTLGTPFTISAKNDVTIIRSKYVSTGTLPSSDPNTTATLTSPDFESGWNL